MINITNNKPTSICIMYMYSTEYGRNEVTHGPSCVKTLRQFYNILLKMFYYLTITQQLQAKGTTFSTSPTVSDDGKCRRCSEKISTFLFGKVLFLPVRALCRASWRGLGGLSGSMGRTGRCSAVAAPTTTTTTTTTTARSFFMLGAGTAEILSMETAEHLTHICQCSAYLSEKCKR